MNGTSADRYRKLAAERSVFLQEAWRSAELTIPALIPDQSDILDRSTPVLLKKPFQSLGARGVNNLASKLVLTLFPTIGPFFRYKVNPKVFENLSPEEEGGLRTELNRAFAKREMQVKDHSEVQGWRSAAFTALRHALVAGNYLIYLPPDGGSQGFALNAFTVKRDPADNIVEIVYVESFERESIEDEEIRSILAAKRMSQGQPEEDTNETVHIFTHIKRMENGKFERVQEVEGELVGEPDTFEEDDLPYIHLRYTKIDGEDYGRGLCEEYRGDLTAFEELSRDIRFASANAAKMIGLLRPGGSLKLRKLQEAENGEWLMGDPDDVAFMRTEKNADMAVAQEELVRLERALAADFLLTQSIQRKGERVTFGEIRILAEELENTLGGVFSLFSQELQLPLIRRWEKQLVRAGAFEALPRDVVAPAIVTGLAALGRVAENDNLLNLVASLSQVATLKPNVMRYISDSELAKRLVTGSLVEADGLLRSDEEVQAELQAEAEQQQRAVLAEALTKAAPGVAKSITDGAVEGNVEFPTPQQ